MSNEFLNAKEYANAMLLLLTNNLVYGGLVDGSLENKVTDENGLKIYKKRPPQFISNSGANLSAQDIIIGEESVTVDQYKNVHVSVGDLERVQSFNELVQSNTMKAAALRLAHDVDSYIAGLTRKFPSWVGTGPGEAISDAKEFNKVYTRLMNQGVPETDLNSVITYDTAENIRGDLIDTNINQINRDALQKSRVPVLSNIDVFASQQVPSLTTGTRTNGAIDGANQNANYRDVKDNAQVSQTLDIDGLGAAGTVKAGEVFTIANVLAYDNRSGQALDYNQQFTVLEDATADGAGAATVTITPAIIVPNTNDGTSTVANTAFATVDSAPADSAVVTWFGSASTVYRQQAAWQKSAISLVSAKLAMPFTGTASYAKDPKTGLFIRYWRGSDISTGAHIHRWDMIYGAEVMDSRLGSRVSGQS